MVFKGNVESGDTLFFIIVFWVEMGFSYIFLTVGGLKGRFKILELEISRYLKTKNDLEIIRNSDSKIDLKIF